MGLIQLLSRSTKPKDKKEKEKTDPNRVKIPITDIVYGLGFPRISSWDQRIDEHNIPLTTLVRMSEVYCHLRSEGIPLDKVSEEDRKYLERATGAVLHIDMGPDTYELSFSVELSYVAFKKHKAPVCIKDQNPFDRKDREKPTF